MRYLIVEFTWILVVTVHTGRWFARLVHFGCDIAHGVVQWFSSALIICSTITYFVILSIMLSNYDTLAHSTLEWWPIVLTCDRWMLSTKDWTFVELFKISPVYTICTSLGIVVWRHCGDDSRWSAIDRIASCVRHVDWWVVTHATCHRANIMLL
jgi:hypothetical protein